MLLIGLMSGTSVDGIDAALVEVEGAAERPSWRLLSFLCLPWEAPLRAEILNACRADAPLAQVVALNFRLGERFAEAAQAVAEGAGTSLEAVDAVASHGQTVWHQPTPIPIGGVPTTGTLQIGEPAVIAARTGCLVVADFRSADMALGGQGAPLVPFADYLLFSNPEETRAVQNLGGIANATYLPAGSGPEGVFAFDTGPGNMLLDELAKILTAGAQRCDLDGALAAKGQVHQGLLAECLEHPFFSQLPPKSTGREQFGQAYAEALLHKARDLEMGPEEMLATATMLTAETISRAYRDWLTPRGEVKTVILGGGGVHNRTLVEMLRRRLAPARLTTHQEFGLPDDAKEAVAFALLAYATLNGVPSNLPAATGASGPTLLGKIVPPPTGLKRFRWS